MKTSSLSCSDGMADGVSYARISAYERRGEWNLNEAGVVGFVSAGLTQDPVSSRLPSESGSGSMAGRMDGFAVLGERPGEAL